ncbi:MAG: 4Fe-4S binding protein [Candidatus Bathyarchaeota archaeon]|nr:4Fe-4S binding protein [Candidatus Bathyarchaeota archaeon]
MDEGSCPVQVINRIRDGRLGVEKPEIDHSKCTKCMLCHFFCPEGIITVRDDGYIEVDPRLKQQIILS